MIEVIGAFIGNLLTSAFGDGLCHGIGFIYVWLQNKGRKSYKQIRGEQVFGPHFITALSLETNYSQYPLFGSLYGGDVVDHLVH
jgi:hypothetical protein